MAKETIIVLETEAGVMGFPVEQADKLLRMPRNGGWHLPNNSVWQWSPAEGFSRKRRAEETESRENNE